MNDVREWDETQDDDLDQNENKGDEQYGDENTG